MEEVVRKRAWCKTLAASTARNRGNARWRTLLETQRNSIQWEGFNAKPQAAFRAKSHSDRRKDATTKHHRSNP
jgi:hypothetical protein